MTSASFRIRKTPSELEVEFAGESEVTLQQFETNLERILNMKHDGSEGTDKPAAPNGQQTEKRTFKKTGEQALIRGHLTSMKSEGWFKQPKLLGEIKAEARTRGWYHDSNDLQYALLQNANELQIKRIQDGKNYKYVEIA